MAISQTKKRKSHPVRALLLLAQPTVILLAVVIVALQWRIPTVIQANMTVAFSEVVTNETELILLLQSDRVQSFKIKEGEIRYPDFSDMDVVVLTTPVRIELKPVGQFRVENVARNLERQEIRFQLFGMAEHIRIVSDGGVQDLRSTRFTVLKRSRTALFMGMTAWAIFTAAGWFKVYQELKA